FDAGWNGGVTGSAAMRQNTLTRGFLAKGNAGQLANFLNHLDDSHRPGRRTSPQQWTVPREFHCGQSAVCERYGRIESRRAPGFERLQLDLPLDESAGDETPVSRPHQSDVVHVEPKFGRCRQ